MKILALEPWFGGSHRRFLDGLVAHSAHEVRTVTMAARYWKWRMQGGAVTPPEATAPEATARQVKELRQIKFYPTDVWHGDGEEEQQRRGRSHNARGSRRDLPPWCSRPRPGFCFALSLGPRR